jgi:hypothetical protein
VGTAVGLGVEGEVGLDLLQPTLAKSNPMVKRTSNFFIIFLCAYCPPAMVCDFKNISAF